MSEDLWPGTIQGGVHKKMPLKRKLADVIEKYRLHPQFIGMRLVDPNQAGAMGDTMLHFAAEAGSVEDIEVLTAAGAIVNVIGDIGNAPIHGAAMMGKIAAARRLVELGADLTLKNEFGESAIDVATSGGHHELAEILRIYKNRKA